MVSALSFVLAMVASTPPVFRGGEGELDIAIPRLNEPDIRIDGRLNEAA